MTKNIAWYARRYIERFGLHLVPIEPRRKFPRSKDWGNTCLSNPDEAEAFYTKNPEWNMGVSLGPSRLCSLDIDCWDSFIIICDAYGIDIDDLIKHTPTVLGRGKRLEFRVPDGVMLPYLKMNWWPESDPTGEIHRQLMKDAAAAKESGDLDLEAKIREEAKQHSSYTVFELRSGSDGKQRQDVLPPSCHPETGEPYKWVTQPRDEWPEPPAWLLAIWTNFDKFKPQIKAMCPWAVEPEIPQAKIRDTRARDNSGGNVIQAYINSVALESELSSYGYTPIGKRWLSPHSSTNLPGVVIFPDGNSCWIHHASDPLCSDDTGRPVNAFDLFSYYDHGGDIKKAVRAAADQLGIRLGGPVDHTPSVSSPASVSVTAPEPANLPANWGSRNYHAPLPYTTAKGKPLKHIDNLAEICIRLGVTIRYNVIGKEEEIIIPNQSFSVDNAANASVAWLNSECSLYDFSTDKVGEFLTYIADNNLYNPVASWIISTPWDGVCRLQDLYETVTAVGEGADPAIKKLKETLLKRWMISAVAAATMPNGISAAGVLVFQGAQYLGKTKWFKSLVPSELGVLKDGMLLRPDDKDSVKQICSYWLVELGELDSTFRKSDIAALKAFLTNDSDVLRRAYARKESKFARRTVFFGSVNPREYLNDPTGNRRFWTIECAFLDHTHNLEMQQIWAEVLYLFQHGEGYYLTPEEMNLLNQHNESFTSIDPVEERILSKLCWEDSPDLWRWEQATNVLMDCGFDRPTRQDAATAASVIRKYNGGLSKRGSGKTLLKVPMKRSF